jgi:hypothetical protein
LYQHVRGESTKGAGKYPAEDRDDIKKRELRGNIERAGKAKQISGEKQGCPKLHTGLSTRVDNPVLSYSMDVYV